MEKRGYGVGIQSFEDMISRECVYVDKTAYIYKMAQSKAKAFFLSRPRRFGKSLLISTMKAYFEGRRDLFKGLAIDKMETEWTAYPVIRIDFSRGKYYEFEQVHSVINDILKEFESQWNIIEVDDPYRYDTRLTNIIKRAYQQTGRQVVVLVDEYDAPMLDSIHNPELQSHIRDRIRSLFSPLKAQSDYLRFVFLAGISKFSQLSIFSELNNLNVLTFDAEYEGICGITEEELLTQLKPDIEWLTEVMKKSFPQTTLADTVAQLKRRYDGYHFSKNMADVYNPWSLIYAFEKGEIQDYWFSTGTPTMLVELLQSKRMEWTALEHIEVNISRFDAPTERINDPIPVLFQSGYLTLKAYDPQTDLYTLGFPNEEVHRGFAGSLYQYYMEPSYSGPDGIEVIFKKFSVKRATFEQFMESIRKWYSSIPYNITDRNQNEQFYQSLLYALLVALGADVWAEESTSNGRMDIVLKMTDAIYIIEFKYDKSAEEAVSQIVDKNYAMRFSSDSRPVYAVGLNIDKDQRSIDDWTINKIEQETRGAAPHSAD